MKETLLAFGIACLILGSLILGAIFLTGLSSDTAYSGKEVFETEKAYSNFKRIVGNKAVDIEAIEVLSSAPPIVVDYHVSVDKDYEFPYGKEKSLDGGALSRILTSVFLIGGLVLTTLGIALKGDSR